MRKFDLNIEKILENWEIHHAIREVIANAIDEQTLTNSKPIEVYKEDGCWVIRDYGRGLKYTSLTQNENSEKLENPYVIGKFGIGLKDALATFSRHRVQIEIYSKYNKITTELFQKASFPDILTLHAVIDENDEPNFIGTKVVLKNVSDEDMEKAKELFIMFSDDKTLSSTKYGDIVERKGKIGFVYLNGVKVAEEENFLYSYNIRNISKQIRKALNRERSSVGRTAYTETVKKILLNSKSEQVAIALAREFEKIPYGTEKDELKWKEVQLHAVKILNVTGKYVFLCQDEAFGNNDILENIKIMGKTPLVIPSDLRDKISGQKDITGNDILDLSQFIRDYNDSFSFDFVDVSELNENEREIFNYTDTIIDLFGGLPKKVKEIRISNVMRKDFFYDKGTKGCWDIKTSTIIISRSQLRKLEDYAATLLHELIHADTGYDDVSSNFENELTNLIGMLAYKLITTREIKKNTIGSKLF